VLIWSSIPNSIKFQLKAHLFCIQNVAMQKSVEIIEFEHAKTGSRHTLAMLLMGFAGLGFMAYRGKSKPALMAV
jgi:hypothetical protein